MVERIELVMVLVGILAAAILFRKFPKLLPASDGERETPSISVIIPARNEAMTLPLLLTDLRQQKELAFEILCVDDDSEDATATVARDFGAKVIKASGKPKGWLGKAWACFMGARAAQGDLLLFLDADVRLGENALARLVQTQQTLGGTISVQPKHLAEKPYEQLSLIFNLVQIGANGAAMIKPPKIGLYGPVILMERADYWRVGGHEAVAGDIVEDVALGLKLKEVGLDYKTFIGDDDVTFRMYPDGFRALIQGWTKNFASGAAKAPLHLLILTILWISSMLSVPIQLIDFGLGGNSTYFLIYLILYCVWMAIIWFLAQKVGRFQPWIIMLYPISLILFVMVFIVSLFKKIFGMKVTWKGRRINTEAKR